MRVDIELVKALKESLNVINRMNIEDIEWYKKGKKIKAKNIERFKFMGLVNTDYVIYEFYKNLKEEKIHHEKK